ncbi:hypothetical protein Tco_0241598 [Tanacetum coccineum]
MTSLLRVTSDQGYGHFHDIATKRFIGLANKHADITNERRNFRSESLNDNLAVDSYNSYRSNGRREIYDSNKAEQRAREKSERSRLWEREQIGEKRKRDLTLRARVAATVEEKKLELLTSGFSPFTWKWREVVDFGLGCRSGFKNEKLIDMFLEHHGYDLSHWTQTEIEDDDEVYDLGDMEDITGYEGRSGGKKGKKGYWPSKKGKTKGESPTSSHANKGKGVKLSLPTKKGQKGVLLRSPNKGKMGAYIRSPSKKGAQGESSADKGKAEGIDGVSQNHVSICRAQAIKSRIDQTRVDESGIDQDGGADLTGAGPIDADPTVAVPSDADPTVAVPSDAYPTCAGPSYDETITEDPIEDFQVDDNPTPQSKASDTAKMIEDVIATRKLKFVGLKIR